MGGRLALVLSFALMACGPSAAGGNAGDAAAPGGEGTDGGGSISSSHDASGGSTVDGTQPLSDAGTSGDDGSDACTVDDDAASPQVLSGEVLAVDETCGAADGGAPPLVGPVPSSTVLQFDIGLPDRNQSELNEYLNAVSDPSSPQYRMYLTTAQYTAMFGPTVCDYNAVIAWAESQGFTVTMTYSDRSLVDLSGSVSAVNAAFHVTINYYLRPDGTQFFAPNVDPSIDLMVPVLWDDSLDNCAVPTPAH